MSKKEWIKDDYIFPFDINGDYLKSVGHFRSSTQKQPFCQKRCIENTTINIVNNVSIETKTTTEMLVFWIPGEMLMEKEETISDGKINLEDFGFKIG